tara:strand:- start:787 stop:1014 length:228 start_codon:yes stop_codon:yes gene_type:complete
MFDWLKLRLGFGTINVCSAPFGDTAFDCKRKKFNIKKKTVEIPRGEYLEMKLQMMKALRKPHYKWSWKLNKAVRL